MDIPPEILIKATIQAGSVYLFPEEAFFSTKLHYFIVVNHDPRNDPVILLACSSSQIDKTKRRRRNCPSETIVEIKRSEYPDFTEDSVVDCNRIIKHNIENLVGKLTRKELEVKTEMDITIIKKLRAGLLASPSITGEDKSLLREPIDTDLY